MREEALAHPVVGHLFLARLASGELPARPALRGFARRYRTYSRRFPEFLRATLGVLRPGHRRLLQDNLDEESGRYGDAELAALASAGVEAEWVVGVPHPELFERFAAAVEAPSQPCPSTDRWCDALLALCWEGPAQAVGALGFGTEAIVSSMYASFLPALERGAVSPRDGVFFPLHVVVDDDHTASLEAIGRDLDPHRMRGAMLRALELRGQFFDELLAELD